MSRLNGLGHVTGAAGQTGAGPQGGGERWAAPTPETQATAPMESVIRLIEQGRLAEAAAELEEILQSIQGHAEEDYWERYEELMRCLTEELGARRFHIAGDCMDYAELLVVPGDFAFFVQVDFTGRVHVGVIYKDGFDAITATWLPHFIIDHIAEWRVVE